MKFSCAARGYGCPGKICGSLAPVKTNGLLRLCRPKNCYASVYSQEEPNAIAARLNGRSHKTLNRHAPLAWWHKSHARHGPDFLSLTARKAVRKTQKPGPTRSREHSQNASGRSAHNAQQMPAHVPLAARLCFCIE